MTPIFVAIFLLGLSSQMATAANFTLVYEWPDKWECECPSEANSTKVLSIESSNPGYIDPQFMAVYGSRIFIILEKHVGIPVSLVSLPTSSASPAPPKLTPFPSWDMHGNDGDCDKIESSRGLEVDSVGKLWVLDNGSSKCNYSKIWSIDLANNDQTKLIHRFPFYGHLNDLVLDETPNGTFAYITRWFEQNIVVFSLERNQSWTVDTPGIMFFSIAISPMNQEPRQLYLGGWNSKGLYSISVAALRNGTLTANPKLIGNWTTSKSYRMLMDKHGTLFSAFWYKNYVKSWNTSQPFLERRFIKVGRHQYKMSFSLNI
ncbi:Hypothetical predicted protein [Cloeon dipterum]|uniref:Bee-milk protein n=1 Tax=Cloeon dipterum TaxID=197152 RepID=A0A8S1E249_9INSE|nr:Hypothetical predicted protein [Cloeon dipterum]